MKDILDNPNVCGKYDLAAYLDGELTAEGERMVDEHLSVCPHCNSELNLQKRFLSMLESEVGRSPELPLPKDFAKRIVVTAESNVSGLRNKSEQFNALFLVATVALFCLFALGAEASGMFQGLTKTFDAIASVVAVVVRVTASFFIGLSVVLRNVAAPLEGANYLLLLPAILTVPILYSMGRMLVRLRRI
ncbi:MAG TPA: zf-HC2 domain-containing protein [Pyrinomonadaceae bacterium]|nr:zf-HC2 domain-containing protein [Pyrinomonadaceae bacterium]